MRVKSNYLGVRSIYTCVKRNYFGAWGITWLLGAINM